MLADQPSRFPHGVDAAQGALRFSVRDLLALIFVVCVLSAATAAVGLLSAPLWICSLDLLRRVCGYGLVAVAAHTLLAGIGWGAAYALIAGSAGVMFDLILALLLLPSRGMNYGYHGLFTLLGATSGLGFGLLRSIVYTINVLRDPH